jgi:hypothetical protein
VAAGVSIKAMSDRSGHANSRTTLDRYARVLAGQDKATAEAIDAALAPPAKRQAKTAAAKPKPGPTAQKSKAK